MFFFWYNMSICCHPLLLFCWSVLMLPLLLVLEVVYRALWLMPFSSQLSRYWWYVCESLLDWLDIVVLVNWLHASYSLFDYCSLFAWIWILQSHSWKIVNEFGELQTFELWTHWTARNLYAVAGKWSMVPFPEFVISFLGWSKPVLLLPRARRYSPK